MRCSRPQVAPSGDLSSTVRTGRYGPLRWAVRPLCGSTRLWHDRGIFTSDNPADRSTRMSGRRLARRVGVMLMLVALAAGVGAGLIGNGPVQIRTFDYVWTAPPAP
ncbi:hypothetical protein GCM10027259_18070 [Micromonospora palomenae]